MRQRDRDIREEKREKWERNRKKGRQGDREMGKGKWARNRHEKAVRRARQRDVRVRGRHRKTMEESHRRVIPESEGKERDGERQRRGETHRDERQRWGKKGAKDIDMGRNTGNDKNTEMGREAGK